MRSYPPDSFVSPMTGFVRCGVCFASAGYELNSRTVEFSAARTEGTSDSASTNAPA